MHERSQSARRDRRGDRVQIQADRSAMTGSTSRSVGRLPRGAQDMVSAGPASRRPYRATP